MIAADLDTSKKIAARINALPFAELSEGSAEANRVLRPTLIDPDFPGALLPEVSSDGDLQILVIAAPADWRRLRPVLQAFAGPTLTSFDGLPSPLPVESSVAAAMQDAGTHVTAVIKLPVDAAARDLALRAISRAHGTLARAPKNHRVAPEPTSWLLARFQDYLNVGRREAASAILSRLRTELRLDALNLKALQVQLLATFEDWAGIVDLTGFANLSVARRTPAVTALMLEALYQVYLAADFDQPEQSPVKMRFAETVRPLALPLLTLPIPVSLREGGWRLYALEALLSPGRHDLAFAVAQKADVLGWLGEELTPPDPLTVSKAEPIDLARELIVASEETESVDSMAAALAALARLSDDQRTELALAEPFKSAVRNLQSEATSGLLPTSWKDWLSRVGDPNFKNALDLARLGSEEWSFAAESGDPVQIKALLQALDSALGDELATERTAQALPFIVAAICRDERFPSPSLSPIYASLLTLLALGAARGGTVYDSSQLLVDALLTVGVDQHSYRALIADVEEIAGPGFGVDMVYWALEIVEAFMRAPAPDATAREEFLHKVLARIAPLRSRLSNLQGAAIRRLADEFGWVLEENEDGEDRSTDELSAKLRDKKIAIYSLSENASRQAKAALEAAVPGLQVECSADHGGTSRLRSLATNSELFVIAWAAAKHAATDFIRTHRGDRPLVYAQGKGFSSLLRAVEDHFRLSSRI